MLIAHSKDFRDSALRVSFFGHATDRCHVFSGESCHRVFLATPVSKALATLCGHVANVVGSSSYEQVIRITARWVVANMKGALAGLQYAARQLKQNARGLATLAVQKEQAVTVFVGLSGPRPTLVFASAINARPEAGRDYRRPAPAVMAARITEWLTGELSRADVATRGYSGALSAPAEAKTGFAHTSIIPCGVR